MAPLQQKQPAEVWNNMLERDVKYYKLRNQKMLDRHPSLAADYRTKLFDWLSEVSEAFHFHRETYHLALDYIDRYLAVHTNVAGNKFQLIGATCLFIAAKFEEIRPPTVNEFAYLTDGGCTADEIINQEAVILCAIDWEITPVTPNTWLNTYGSSIVFNHQQVASVIDLALLHIESLRFSNLTLTASALYHFTNDRTVRQITGFKYQDLAECINWLQPFVDTIKCRKEPCCLKETKSAQMHVHIKETEDLFHEAIARMEFNRRTSIKRKANSLLEDEITDSENDSVLSSPLKPSTILLTPPTSARKSRKYIKRS